MPENLSIEQISLIACVAIGGVIGLFRGLSGGLGTLGGIVASIAAGWSLFNPLSEFIASREWVAEGLAQTAATAAAVGIVGLLVFGLVRKLIEKFVRYLVPRTFDAFLGIIAGGCIGFAAWRAVRWVIDIYLQGGGEAIQGAVAA